MPLLLSEFMPILTAHTYRIGNLATPQLRATPAALARSLLDSQRLVGHDGIICIFDTQILVDACLIKSDGRTELREPESVPYSEPFASILNAVRALRPQLPQKVRVYSSFTGPELLLEELAMRSEDLPDADLDYAGDVFLAAVRESFNAEAHGIAVIEKSMATVLPQVDSLYRSANRIAEFYDGAQIVFHLPSEAPRTATSAHCSFFLQSSIRPYELVRGVGIAGTQMPFTTASDVPEDTPIQTLRELTELAREKFIGNRPERSDFARSEHEHD